MPDGEYRLGAHRAIKKDGAIRLADGTLAGSVLTMDAGLAQPRSIGLPLAEASRRLSTIPADWLGHDRHRPHRARRRADLLVLDADPKRRARSGSRGGCNDQRGTCPNGSDHPPQPRQCRGAGRPAHRGAAARQAGPGPRPRHGPHDGAGLRPPRGERGLLRALHHVQPRRVHRPAAGRPATPTRTTCAEHLFSKVDIDPANTHLPDGNGRRPRAAARDYEAGSWPRAASTCSSWASARRGTSASTSRSRRSCRGRATRR